jgi:hypothetical protein
VVHIFPPAAPRLFVAEMGTTHSLRSRRLCGQIVFGSSVIIESRYSVSSQKISEIFLKPALLQPIPVCMMIA